VPDVNNSSDSATAHKPYPTFKSGIGFAVSAELVSASSQREAEGIDNNNYTLLIAAHLARAVNRIFIE